MSLIDITNLTFAYDDSYDPIFENVSFQIDTDWKLGFIGRNGRGKTTFLNLLLRKYEYGGSISAGVCFEYFPYEVPDKNANTMDVIQNVCPQCEEWKIIRELSLLDVCDDILYRPFSTLSNGEQTKALLAALFLNENHFLLIDEPTNHLDAKARQTVADYLNRKNGFILVSHDRSFLDHCIDHVLSINRANIEIQKGNFSSWWQNKQMRDQFELDENEKLSRDIKRLSAATKRTADWSDKVEKSKIGTKNSGLKPDRGYLGHKAAKMMKRSKSIQARQRSALEEKSRLLKNIEDSESLKISPLKFHTNRLVELDQVSIFYEDKIACREISFVVEQGDRIALCGKNGCGKSSILKLICGEKINYRGSLSKNDRLKISYVPQSTAHLSGNLTDYAQQYGINESLFKAILRKLDFPRTQFEKNMEDFSGGQKKKVLIARSLCERAHLYIWDEPLNFIDVISRMQIEELLIEYQPTIIFVEHDRVFCENIATKMIEISP